MGDGSLPPAPAPAFLNLTFFEKKVSQKTLVGCAANSGAGSGFLQAAPRTVGRVPVLLQAAPQAARYLPRIDGRRFAAVNTGSKAFGRQKKISSMPVGHGADLNF